MLIYKLVKSVPSTYNMVFPAKTRMLRVIFIAMLCAGFYRFLGKVFLFLYLHSSKQDTFFISLRDKHVFM